jgi:hypothetical protein
MGASDGVAMSEPVSVCHTRVCASRSHARDQNALRGGLAGVRTPRSAAFHPAASLERENGLTPGSVVLSAPRVMRAEIEHRVEAQVTRGSP